MNKESLKYVQYWRNSLVDESLQGGEISSKLDTETVSESAWSSGALEMSITNPIFEKLNKNKKNESDKVKAVGILIYASIYNRKTLHATAKRDGIPSKISTVMVVAKLNIDGRITPLKNPYVPRVFLSPIADDKVLTIGTVDTQDEFLAFASWNEPGSWQEIINRTEMLEVSVCDQDVIKVNGFIKGDVTRSFVLADDAGSTKAIIELYDYLIKNTGSKIPLFDRYASYQSSTNIDLPSINLSMSARSGNMGFKNSLADAQRDSLSFALAAPNGSIVGINGPPGTGKTTLLQSVVASLWVNAALNGDKYPPVIAICSTNNQAVTNVIDSFGKVDEIKGDPISGRWIPEIETYACFYPSSLAELNAGGKYLTDSTYTSKENLEFVDKVTPGFIESANKYLGTDHRSIELVMRDLHHKLVERHDIQKHGIATWSRLESEKAIVLEKLGDAPSDTIKSMAESIDESTAGQNKLDEYLKLLMQFLSNESIFYSLFNFIPPVARKRVDRALYAMNAFDYGFSVKNIESLRAKITEYIQHAARMIQLKTDKLNDAVQLLENLRHVQERWDQCLSAIGLEPGLGLHEYDKGLDITIRQQCFKLATHYWEAAWINEIRSMFMANEKDTVGIVRLQRKMRRRGMLAPCAVSTLYRLPIVFKTFDNGVNAPMLDYIDYLIMDESGQVLPSTGGCAFALSKRALIVGDIQQIKPVAPAESQAKIDAGNLIEAGINTDPLELERSGRQVMNGSVMKVAQYTTDCHYAPDLERGLYLFEHRRCVDDIIQISNVLCYKGRLIPKRGNAQAGQHGLPRVGYINIPGVSEVPGASRHNVMEAQGIVLFLKERLNDIKAAYPGRSVESLIAIITPFKAQSNKILEMLKASGLPELVVGTVHKMQGAEYPVVIFSPTYSIHDRAMRMIDDEPNMLNVAVSRAQDSFIVAGDMNVFDQKTAKPSGVLARALFGHPDNEIIVKDLIQVVYRNSGQSDLKIESINTLDAHNKILDQALLDATNEVIIISPWIKIRAITDASLEHKVMATVRQGVKVIIYAAFENNDLDTLKQRNQEKEADNSQAGIDVLVRAGAEVRLISMIHNKDIFVDEIYMCRGSFNWLSANRAAYNNVERLDSSVKISGEMPSTEKKVILEVLNKRLKKTISTNT